VVREPPLSYLSQCVLRASINEQYAEISAVLSAREKRWSFWEWTFGVIPAWTAGLSNTIPDVSWFET